MFLGEGKGEERGLFADEWWVLLSDVVPDVSQDGVHSVLLSGR